jgi:hypothetical protein
MAELVLSSVGRAIGARLPGALGTIGSALGRAGGALLGRAIDQQLFGAAGRYEGARLTDLHIQGSTEGALIPAVFGRVRLAGQVIWATRFKERVKTRDVGGKGGPRVTTKSYRYSLSFAVGLCEGEIARIARVWANGEPLDMSATAWRLHAGAEDQPVDPLIEAIEGTEYAPAYRGLAYIVFEDLPLEQFGHAIPQLSFEIVRLAPGTGSGQRFEEKVKSVCLIPGAGEFVYATTPVLRQLGPGQESAENVHAERDRANLLVSLDQLKADFPNCETVTLVVAWFGNDLRCGTCQIRPGVEIASKQTTPVSWRAGGVTRSGAHVVSQHQGSPAFGGTPSDASVLATIAELKARGYKVRLYPFLLMDVPLGNTLPDPYGGAAQAAYPWRGRISVHPAAGQPGAPDKTAAATLQVTAFFGAANASHFDVSDGVPNYAGPTEWSYRRFVLHYAKLAQLAGGVDAFIIGSEMRALTTARDGPSSYPGVAALRNLAAEARVVLGPGVKLTYAADWSEYGGHRPQDGTGDVHFHLDPLWADANIDVVGIDWYPSITDWRAGATHLDAAISSTIYNAEYLKSRIEAGEDFEWYYTSDAARAAQSRTPINDGAYAEPWIYRAKDVRNFWARSHHDRPGGVRAASPTAWVPQSKPIWFVELGCPAVDKGANAPHVFNDCKSAESALPPFSSGARDDLIQRYLLDVYLDYWAPGSSLNPTSALSGKPMIEDIGLWCWDARPHPAFPTRADVWADGGAWRLGHWLNGRAGLSGLGEVVRAICLRAGVEQVDVSALVGAVSGYVVDAAASARAALEPLMAAYDFAAVERDGAIVFYHRSGGMPTEIGVGDFAAELVGDTFAQRGDAAEAPIEARVRFIDAARDYLIANVSARRRDAADGGIATIDAPLVLEVDAAEALADRWLADRRAETETLRLALGPQHMALEPGDSIRIGGDTDVFEVVRVEDAEPRRVDLRRLRPASSQQVGLADPSAPPIPLVAPTPVLDILDLPLLPGFEDDERPLAAVFASPWLGDHEVFAGAPLSVRAAAVAPAIMGELLATFWPGPVDRWDDGNRVRIKLYGGALESATSEALLDGANVFAIVGADGACEILQARNCQLVAPNEYELSGFLRGRLGSAHAMRAPHPVGARIVVLDDRLARLQIGAHEWNEALAVVAPPQGALASDARARKLNVLLPHAALRPWAPAQLRAQRVAGGDVAISWIRCARFGGDAWGAAEPPLGAVTESYQLEIMNGATTVRGLTVSMPGHIYSAADQIADFGILPASLRIRFAQIGDGGVQGLKTELTVTL